MSKTKAGQMHRHEIHIVDTNSNGNDYEQDGFLTLSSQNKTQEIEPYIIEESENQLLTAQQQMTGETSVFNDKVQGSKDEPINKDQSLESTINMIISSSANESVEEPVEDLPVIIQPIPIVLKELTKAAQAETDKQEEMMNRNLLKIDQTSQPKRNTVAIRPQQFKKVKVNGNDVIEEGQTKQQTDPIKVEQIKKRPNSAEPKQEVTQLDMIKSCLQRDLRSINDIKTIQKYLQESGFFPNLKKDREPKAWDELCEKLKLEEHQAGSVVFNYGDEGKNFYSILSGSVEVRVPSDVQLEQDSVTPEGIISFIVMYFNDIYWKAIEKGSHVLHLFYDELTRCNLNFDNEGRFNQNEVLKALDQEITNGTTIIHRQIYKVLNPENDETIQMKWFKTIATLSQGQQFGDLALQYHQMRSATIVCVKATSLLSLTNHDYNAILQKEERRKTKRNVQEIQNYRIFANVRSNLVAKIYLYMKRKEYKRGQIIYKEGDLSIDQVYFTIDGEYEVTKLLSSKGQEREANENQTSIERQICKSPVRIQKVKDLLRVRSEKMMKHLGSASAQSISKKSEQKVAKQVQLYRLGKNEVFGIEYRLDKNNLFGLKNQNLPEWSESRTNTVTCIQKGVCYIMSRENFEYCANNFGFQDQVKYELILKHKLLMKRIQQTAIFQKNFFKKEHEKFILMQKWAEWSEIQAVEKKIKEDSRQQALNGDSKMSLNSSLDVSQIRQNQGYDIIHPRKSETVVIQQFKKQMLSSAIKPTSWQKQQSILQKTEILNDLRNKEFDKQLQINDANLPSTQRCSIREDPSEVLHTNNYRFPSLQPNPRMNSVRDMPNRGSVAIQLSEQNAKAAEELDSSQRISQQLFKVTNKAQRALFDKNINTQQQKQESISIHKQTKKLLKESIREQMVTSKKSSNRKMLKRLDSISKIGSSLSKLSSLDELDSQYQQNLQYRVEEAQKNSSVKKRLTPVVSEPQPFGSSRNDRIKRKSTELEPQESAGSGQAIYLPELDQKSNSIAPLQSVQARRGLSHYFHQQSTLMYPGSSITDPIQEVSMNQEDIVNPLVQTQDKQMNIDDQDKIVKTLKNNDIQQIVIEDKKLSTFRKQPSNQESIKKRSNLKVASTSLIDSVNETKQTIEIVLNTTIAEDKTYSIHRSKKNIEMEDSVDMVENATGYIYSSKLPQNIIMPTAESNQITDQSCIIRQSSDRVHFIQQNLVASTIDGQQHQPLSSLRDKIQARSSLDIRMQPATVSIDTSAKQKGLHRHTRGSSGRVTILNNSNEASNLPSITASLKATFIKGSSALNQKQQNHTPHQMRNSLPTTLTAKKSLDLTILRERKKVNKISFITKPQQAKKLCLATEEEGGIQAPENSSLQIQKKSILLLGKLGKKSPVRKIKQSEEVVNRRNNSQAVLISSHSEQETSTQNIMNGLPAVSVSVEKNHLKTRMGNNKKTPTVVVPQIKGFVQAVAIQTNHGPAEHNPTMSKSSRATRKNSARNDTERKKSQHRSSIQAKQDLYALQLPEHLRKPLVQHRQQLKGHSSTRYLDDCTDRQRAWQCPKVRTQVGALSPAQSIGHMPTAQATLPMQISTKVLVESSSLRNLKKSHKTTATTSPSRALGVQTATLSVLPASLTRENRGSKTLARQKISNIAL